MSTLTIYPPQSVTGKGRAFTGVRSPRWIPETIRISEDDIKQVTNTEGLTKAQFMADLKKASAPLQSREPGRKLSKDAAILWASETYAETLRALED